MRMWPRRLLTLLGLTAAILIGTVALRSAAGHTFAGVVSEPPSLASDFTLTDEAGEPFSLSALRGQWILLTYGYTSCPDVCPLTLAHLRDVKQILGADAERVSVVFVSVDPERDTVDVVRRYVGHFGGDFKGLTGTPAAVADAASAFGVKYEKKVSSTAVGYSVSHTAYVFLIDPAFRVRVTFPFGVKSSEIASDVEYLMNSK